MTRQLCGVCVAVGLATAATEAQVTFVETFDNYSNVGGWTYGSPNGYIDLTGGNPGPFFHDPFLDTFAPRPRTTMDSIFTGDYRANQVSSVGIDLILFDVQFSAGGRPLSLILVSDNNTPGSFDDDWGAYNLGPANVPLPGEGWLSYDFDVPSQQTSLPTGWQYIEFGPNSPTPDWNNIITDVSQLQYFYGDPQMMFIFQVWDVGMDNPRITYIPEPGAVGLTLAALAALIFRRR